jgi:GNAT superfamily N-acetyltransferase
MHVRPATADDLDALLALIADYQHFYADAAPPDEQNAAFFARFIAPSERGMLIVARDPDADAAPAGYACLYWTYSSVSASDVVLMNDLYVRPELRGAGVGQALIAATVQIARERGASHVRWYTEPDNHRAQRLYDAGEAQRSTWLEYEIAVDRVS